MQDWLRSGPEGPTLAPRKTKSARPHDPCQRGVLVDQRILRRTLSGVFESRWSSAAMPKKLDADPVYSEYEELGEDRVQADINARRYNERKTRTAKAWLEKKAQERSDSLTREQIDVARDAASSARVSAEAATASANASEAANNTSRIAILIAGASFLLVVGDLFLW